MAITVELDPELEQRALDEASNSAGGDLSAVVAAALAQYLTIQEAMRYVVANPPPPPDNAGLPGLGEIISKGGPIDLGTVLQATSSEPIDVEAIKQGKAQLPPDVATKLGHGKGGVDLVDILKGGGEIPDNLADRLRDVARGGDDPMDEETVARALASSYLSSEKMSAAAEGAQRIARRVEELRSGG